MLEASQQNLAKASEFLWGAIAEAVKSIFALADKRLGSHREIINALRETVLKEEVEKKREYIRCANQLHINFYEGYVDKIEFLSLSQTAYELISKLFRIWETLTKRK